VKQRGVGRGAMGKILMSVHVGRSKAGLGRSISGMR